MGVQRKQKSMSVNSIDIYDVLICAKKLIKIPVSLKCSLSS